jgi:hypothetical protein
MVEFTRNAIFGAPVSESASRFFGRCVLECGADGLPGSGRSGDPALVFSIHSGGLDRLLLRVIYFASAGAFASSARNSRSPNAAG